jgi:small redox-active disulfide protein 2
MLVKVLGSGCPSCKTLYESVKKVVGENEEIKVEYITEITALLEAGIMSSPALIIDDITVSVGRVPTEDEIGEYIEARKNFKKPETSQCGCGTGCCS